MSSSTEQLREYERLKSRGRELSSASALEDARQALEGARVALENLYQAERDDVLSILDDTSHRLVQKNLALGDSAVADENLDQAREYFQIALDVAYSRADKEEAQIRLGQLDQRAAPRETLEKIYKKLSHDPDSPGLIYDFATTLAMEGYVPEAIRHLERLTELTPEDSDVYYRLGNAYFDARRYEEAEAAYEKALAIGFEDKAEIRYREGRLVFHQKADHAQAKRCFKEALQENPKHLDTLKGLAHLNDLEGNEEEAIKLFDRAIQVDPEDPELPLVMASLYRRLEEYERAIEVCKKAIADIPDGESVEEIEQLIEEIRAEEEENREFSGR